MELTDSTATPPPPPPPPPPSQSTPGPSLQPSSDQEDHYVASITEEHEVTCWGCGLILILTPYTPIFKCGWCGAITNHNALKCDISYLWWRRLRDRCFVCVLLLFMSFIIGGGIWAIYPVVFAVSNFCGIFHMTISVVLSVTTISTYILSAFRSPGTPPLIPWGSYPTVGKGGLEGYTFCNYCSKPKSSNTHHCRSCGICVLDMDHHCPFIGNCVGTANHRVFIIFLISAVISNFYVSLVSSFSAFRIWPPMRNFPLSVLSRPTDYTFVYAFLKEIAFSFFTSVESLSIRGLILIYLFIASISVEIGLCVLLWQQMSYIYEGKTYLSHLSSKGTNRNSKKDCQNIVRFFGCPYSATRYVVGFWNSGKIHKK
ncbi:protein S-acyltransferase 11-like isoform X2 [Rutidosis leptorrhynchoides]|uniref:protein S-acyltransferase 11-like isoform X2 n=1 Tax=Rutidosis leptorrhynchoides TaxID=125765 RepID=UPI003A9A4DC1